MLLGKRMGEEPLFNIRFQSISGRWKMDENHVIEESTAQN